MNAVLSKGDGHYLITYELPNGKAMPCLTFSDWLSARVLLDILGDEECLTINAIKDVTGECGEGRWNQVKGVDYAFTF